MRGLFVRYIVAISVIALGMMAAGTRFPGGFDWAYTVVSRLASPRHNPAGAPLFCVSALIAVIAVWPIPRHLGDRSGAESLERIAATALRLSFCGVVFLAVEGLFRLDAGSWIRKGHEAVALLTFLTAYAGILGLYALRIRRDRAHAWPLLGVVAPLVGVAVAQVALYLDQRDLGWVNQSWRELGVPIWMSFAFWQWAAIVLLGLSLGHLVLTAQPESRR